MRMMLRCACVLYFLGFALLCTYSVYIVHSPYDFCCGYKDHVMVFVGKFCIVAYLHEDYISQLNGGETLLSGKDP